MDEFRRQHGSLELEAFSALNGPDALVELVLHRIRTRDWLA